MLNSKMLDYTIIRSNRKTLALEVTKEAKLVVRAPIKTSEKKIKEFVSKNEKWAVTHLKKREERNSKKPPELTDVEIAELKIKAKEVLSAKTEYYAKIMNVSPKYVKITSAKTRLGSCSSDKAICFSYRLMLYPEECIDYVVVHELAHIYEMNHSSRFYDIVRKYYPNYSAVRKLIKITNL